VRDERCGNPTSRKTPTDFLKFPNVQAQFDRVTIASPCLRSLK
jgi:hypothetical protein